MLLQSFRYAHCMMRYSVVLYILTFHIHCRPLVLPRMGCWGAVLVLCRRCARVYCAGVGGVRRVLKRSQGASLRSDGFAGTFGGSCVSSGPGLHAGLARPWDSATISKAWASRVPIVMQNVNKKPLNPGIAKNRKWEVFQTVNHSRTFGTLRINQRAF